MKRVFALLGLIAVFAVVTTGRAQQPASTFNITACSAAATCCAVAVPQYTYVPPPSPGAQPAATTTSGPPPILYGFHVTNGNGAVEYAQLFNAAGTPAASSTPLGASSWSMSATADRDVSVGETMGWGGFTNGIQLCCSSTQGTFTAVGSCGFILETR